MVNREVRLVGNRVVVLFFVILLNMDCVGLGVGVRVRGGCKYSGVGEGK